MKILIASPDQMLAQLISLPLVGQGHTIRVCDSERAFCDLYISESFSVVVTLFWHPFVNGVNLALGEQFSAQDAVQLQLWSTAVKTSRRNSKPTIFLLSWHQSEHQVLSFYRSGIDQYMTMPVCVERLVSKIANLKHRR